MHPVAQQLDQLFGQLDPMTASLLEKVIQDAVELARRETPVQETDDLGYPIGYFEATAGSFADEPLERPANLPLETREPWCALSVGHQHLDLLSEGGKQCR